MRGLRPAAALGGPPTVATGARRAQQGWANRRRCALRHGGGTIVHEPGRQRLYRRRAQAGRGARRLEQARRRLARVELIAATDVEHPLLGAQRAARVFGRKGADPATVQRLEEQMTGWAAELDAVTARSAMAGQGPGRRRISAALLALGGRRESGAAVSPSTPGWPPISRPPG